MRRYPRGFLKTLFTIRAADSVPMTRAMLFTADTPKQIVEDCHSRLGRESRRILIGVIRRIRTDGGNIPVVAMGAQGTT
jgi:hypothetical protein